MSRAVIGYLYDQLTDRIKLPVTSVDAVLDKNGKTVAELISEIQPVSTEMVIDTSAGLSLSSGVNRLSVRVFREGVDITDSCDDTDFIWTRSEASWPREGETGKSITVGSIDLVSDKATFVCTFINPVSETEIWRAVSSVTIDGSLHDSMELVGFIQSSLPTMIVDNRQSLTPDWTVSHLVLTPVLRKLGYDTNLNLTNVVNKAWYRRLTGDIGWTKVISGQNGEVIDPRTGVLTVTQNKVSEQDLTCEYKYECKYFDSDTNKSMMYEMQVCFVKVTNGLNGQNGQDGTDGEDGADGQDGIGIKSIRQTKRSLQDEGDNEWTVTKTDDTVDKFYVRNGSKGSDGVDGRNGWTRSIITLYRRSNRNLTRDDIDFGPLTYDVATNSFLEIRHGQIGQWFTSPIAGSSSLWDIFVVIHTQNDQVVVNESDWSTPVILSEAGSSGQPGETTAFVSLYQWADETPVMPHNNIAYNFQTHTISEPRDEHGDLLPWTINIPANNGKTLWCITAVAQGRNDSDVIGYDEWCEPVELVKNGIDGQNGQDGAPGRDGTDGVDGRDGTDGRDGVDGQDGQDGQDGKSAYEIAVEHGYEGTEEEWLLELHTEMRYQYAVVAGDYDYMRSYGPGDDQAYGYINGVGYGLSVEWSEDCPFNVPEGSYIWLRAKNTYSDVWQYARLTGKTGASGGFGTPQASLVEDGGEPSVEVSASGSQQSKVFSFVFKNINGRGIVSVSYRWAVTDTQEQPDLDDIVLIDIPEMTSEHKYLWKKTIELCTDGSELVHADLVTIYGDQGEPGTPVTISNIAYGVSNSSSSYPSVWTQNVPAASQGQWLWTRTTYSNSVVSYSYLHQPVDADSFYVTRQYGLSSSTSSAPSSWSDSVAKNWTVNDYVWVKEIRHYGDGHESSSVAYYDKELTEELKLRACFEIEFSQKNYISLPDSQQHHIIPFTIRSSGYEGVLSMSMSFGGFCSYDGEGPSWIDLGDSISVEIENNSKNTEYALKIPMGTYATCVIESSLQYGQDQELDLIDRIVPVLMR